VEGVGGVVGDGDQLGGDLVVVGVAAERFDRVVDCERGEREGGVDSAADGCDGGKQPFARDCANRLSERAEKPEEEEDADQDEEDAEVDLGAVAALALVGDQLRGRAFC
jgi:hypothetical protein